MDECTFEEYSKRKGCGELLGDGYIEKLNQPPLNYSTSVIISWVVFVIFCIIQVSAVLMSVYIFLQTKSQNSSPQVIYGGTTYR